MNPTLTCSFRVLYPRELHAPLAVDDTCPQHRDTTGYEAPGGESARLWVVRAGYRVVPYPPSRPRSAIRGWQLSAGVRLRLDAARESHFRDGHFGETGDYTISSYRFCVLDGPLAGSCWRQELVVADMWKPWITGEPSPLEPLGGWGQT